MPCNSLAQTAGFIEIVLFELLIAQFFLQLHLPGCLLIYFVLFTIILERFIEIGN